MNVQQVIDILKEYPSETKVIMLSDPEGNNVSPVSDVSQSYYIAETSYHGYEVHPDDLDEYPEAEVVVAFTPTN